MTRLRVATWNIFGGRAWDGSRVDLDLTLAVLRRLDADVVAVQEVDREQARSGTHLSLMPGPNLRQLRALQRHLDERGRPRLLLGDLNLWWPLVRVASRPGWRPLVRGGTFRNRPPGSPGRLVQLDHVLAAGAATLRPRDTRIVSGPASDHRALLVELDWP